MMYDIVAVLHLMFKPRRVWLKVLIVFLLADVTVRILDDIKTTAFVSVH